MTLGSWQVMIEKDQKWGNLEEGVLQYKDSSFS